MKTKEQTNLDLPEVITASLFKKIKFFFIKLLSGKNSILINCRLINTDIVVSGDCLVINNLFTYGEKIENKLKGITIKPRK